MTTEKRNNSSTVPLQLNEYEIWCEGYAATGHRGQAFCFGKAHGENFREACRAFFRVEIAAGKFHTYDPAENRYWGCQLYDNETDARKTFG